MFNQSRAILWAQWKSTYHVYANPAGNGNFFSAIVTGLWYLVWVVSATAVGVFLANPANLKISISIFPAALLLVFLYWQVVPILLVTTGASLDMKKIMVYPVPASQLFGIEVLLRLSTAVEMLTLIVGAAVGLAFNPRIPLWAPLWFIPFVLFNLLLAAGLRDLMARLLARKRIRELAVFLLVLAAALPQLLIFGGVQTKVRGVFSNITGESVRFWPWTATAQLAYGDVRAVSFTAILVWVAAAFAFGRWQFARGLRFDASEVNPGRGPDTRSAGIVEFLFRLPARILPDPISAMVEKELRFLSRAPRFRLVFMMGFSFGLLIWLPMAFRNSASAGGVMSGNYFTFVCLYALLLLGDACFWNVFGFDRAAAQLYFLVPVKMSTVLAAKNIAAVIFVFLEVFAITAVCLLLRMPLSAAKLGEALLVTLVISIYLLSIGNYTSVRNARAVNASRAMRSGSAGQTQAMQLVVYPFVMLPVGMAYLARYAFRSNWAFFGALAFAAIVGVIVYWVATESAVENAEKRKEELLSVLSRGDGPVAS